MATTTAIDVRSIVLVGTTGKRVENLATPVSFHWENESLNIPPNPSRLHLLFHEPKLGHLAALMAAGESG